MSREKINLTHILTIGYSDSLLNESKFNETSEHMRKVGLDVSSSVNKARERILRITFDILSLLM